MDGVDFSTSTQAFVDELVGHARNAMAGVERMQQELRDITVTATSPDRLVTVVVGPLGRIRELRLDPRVYRDADSTSLAETITALIQRAQGDVERKQHEIRSRVMPDTQEAGRSIGVDFEELLRPLRQLGDRD